MKFRNHKVGFREVEDIADKLLSQQKNVENCRAEKYSVVKDLMKHKLNNAMKYEKEVRKQLKTSKDDLDKVVRTGTIARNEFMEVVNVEIDMLWKEGKSKSSDKVKWAEHRNKVSKENMETFRNVIIGDKKLEEYENEILGAKVNTKVSVHGGVELKKEHIEILTIPPKHTIFPKLNIESFETELQKCEVKHKWQMLREQRLNEEKYKKDELKNSNDTDEVEKNKEVFDKEKKVVDFRNLKATDMKNN